MWYISPHFAFCLRLLLLGAPSHVSAQVFFVDSLLLPDRIPAIPAGILSLPDIFRLSHPSNDECVHIDSEDRALLQANQE
jgi:hypothetical protein